MLSCNLLHARQFFRNQNNAWRLTTKSFSTSQHRGKRTHYEVLGLTPSATTAQIKDAFVTLSKQFHPDHNHTDPQSSVKFIRLNEAYTCLVREQSRREYDMSIGVMEGGMAWPAGGRISRSGGGGARIYESEGVGHEGSEFRGHMYSSRSGVRGRVPNYVVAGGCVGIVLLGFLYFLVGYRYTIMRQRSRLDAMDRRNSQYLRESKENARLNGFQRQLEILMEKDEERKREIERVLAVVVAADADDESNS